MKSLNRFLFLLSCMNVAFGVKQGKKKTDNDTVTQYNKERIRLSRGSLGGFNAANVLKGERKNNHTPAPSRYYYYVPKDQFTPTNRDLLVDSGDVNTGNIMNPGARETRAMRRSSELIIID